MFVVVQQESQISRLFAEIGPFRGKSARFDVAVQTIEPLATKPFSPFMPETILYTRQGCHLCDVAGEVLARHGLTFQKVDIDADATLRERYDQCVPVVVIDGKERFRGRIDELLLRRLLSGTH